VQTDSRFNLRILVPRTAELRKSGHSTPQRLSWLAAALSLMAGSLDPNFGTAGIALVTPAPILGPQALALLSNGDYLGVGESGDAVVGTPSHAGGENSPRTDVQASRFSETGTLDTTFADTPFPFGTTPNNTPQALAVQSNGQVVVGGLERATIGPNFGGIARLDTNGELDTTFGSGGTLTVDNNVEALLIDTNGDILAIEGTGNDGIVVAAYLAN